MNCRFCRNFIPDGNESCPVCGRRQDEDTMGKLLSENQPTTLAPTNSVQMPQPQPESKPKKHAKGLFAPFLAIIVSAAGWLYGISQDFLTQLKTIFNGTFGESSQLAEDSDFVTENAGNLLSDDKITMFIIVAVVALLSIIGVVGVVMLLKRLYNRIAYKDE
ncbi:MAG: hypothetical protein IJP17_03050 [Clostridia bacterium]|nr:hypothetical protein [Clostridia bacterium]